MNRAQCLLALSLSIFTVQVFSSTIDCKINGIEYSLDLSKSQKVILNTKNLHVEVSDVQKINDKLQAYVLVDSANDSFAIEVIENAAPNSNPRRNIQCSLNSSAF